MAVNIAAGAENTRTITFKNQEPMGNGVSMKMTVQDQEHVKSDYRKGSKEMFENREIIGIDHGNRNIKTAGGSVFSASVQPVSTRPDSLENVLEYQNRSYFIGCGVPVMERVDKTENEDYYILTLAALAMELKSRKLTSASVRMGTALPPRRFQSQKDGFRKYLSRTKELHFRFEGIHYHVTLENVYVFMQGHVVIHTLLEEIPGFCLLVDIGGGTVDLVGFVDGMPDGNYAISDKAALYCISRVNEETVAKFGTGVPPYIVEAFMRNGGYECPEKYQTEITRCLKAYSADIYGFIQANNYNLDLTNMVFMGGGASIIQHFGKNEGRMVQFISDVCANARGCEAAVGSIMRARKIRKEKSA